MAKSPKFMVFHLRELIYTLVEPAFNDIANQIVTNQSLENIKFDDNSKYTYTILYNAILDTIEKGKVGE